MVACLNRAVEYVQLTEDLETRFMAAVKRMKQAFNLCSSSDAISDKEKDYVIFTHRGNTLLDQFYSSGHIIFHSKYSACVISPAYNFF